MLSKRTRKYVVKKIDTLGVSVNFIPIRLFYMYKNHWIWSSHYCSTLSGASAASLCSSVVVILGTRARNRVAKDVSDLRIFHLCECQCFTFHHFSLLLPIFQKADCIIVVSTRTRSYLVGSCYLVHLS